MSQFQFNKNNSNKDKERTFISNGPTFINDSLLASALKAKNADLYERLKILYPCVDDVTTLPNCWSTEQKAHCLGLTWDYLGCYYRSSASISRSEEHHFTAGSASTDNYIPRSCLIYYFEITFTSKGRDGSMAVGLTSRRENNDVDYSKLPGICKDSYGYQASEGNIMIDNRCHRYGPSYTTGDVIGCGFNLFEKKIFFTKNGLNLGVASEDIVLSPGIYYYPTVGFKSSGEEIFANFGQQEFVYDIEQDLRSIRKGMTNAVTNHPISDYADWQTSIHKLVQSWLIQNSYPKTAQAFSKTAKIEFKENVDHLKQRYRIQQLVLEGRINEAIKLTNLLCPNLLENDPNLLFTLRCRQFIELIIGDNNNSTDIDNSNSNTNICNKVDNHAKKTAMQQNQESQQQQQQSIQEHIDEDTILSMDNINNNNTNMNTNSTNGRSGDEQSSNNHQIDKSSSSAAAAAAASSSFVVDDAENQRLAQLLEFGQELSDFLAKLEKSYGKNEASEKMLHDAISLIAFPNPKQSHVANLLNPKEREPLSQLLNESIVRAEMGETGRLPMEDTMNHLRRVIKLNNSYGKWLMDKLY